MKKEKISQTMNIIAEETVPANLDLWPQIQSKLQPPHDRPFWLGLIPTTPLGRGIAAAMLVLLFGGVAYAVGPLVSQLFQAEAGLKHVQETDLVQPLNLSQTIDGVTFVLDQAYADGNRVVLGYTVISPEDQQYAPQRETLMDLSGVVLPPMLGYGDGAGHYIRSFDASPVQATSHRLDLRLVIYAEEFTLPPEAVELLKAFSQPDGSVAEIPDSLIEKLPPKPKGKTVGPFTFSFSIPFLPSRRIEIQQVFETADASVRLERIVITPSETQAFICLKPPPDGAHYTEWIPITALDTGEGESIANAASYTLSQTEHEVCHRLFFPYPLAGRSGQWTLTVTELVGFSQEDPMQQRRLTGPWSFQFSVE